MRRSARRKSSSHHVSCRCTDHTSGASDTEYLSKQKSQPIKHLLPSNRRTRISRQTPVPTLEHLGRIDRGGSWRNCGEWVVNFLARSFCCSSSYSRAPKALKGVRKFERWWFWWEIVCRCIENVLGWEHRIFTDSLAFEIETWKWSDFCCCWLQRCQICLLLSVRRFTRCLFSFFLIKYFVWN